MPGPYYFAWCNSDTAFNPAIHNREDEQILSYRINHTEGNFATLSIEIVNPYVGLLAPGRPRWAWFSWFNGSSIIPLFYGRLVGLPTNLVDQVITLDLTAKPNNYLAVKAALAATMRVAPWYDPVFIDPQYWDDPDTVLEGYTALWEIDRVTHAVTASDIITGADGVDTFAQSEIFYDSVQISIGTTPLVAVNVNASVTWTQQYSGELTLLSNRTFGGEFAESLYTDWPKDGKNLGGGWSVKQSYALDVGQTDKAETVTGNWSWENNEKEHRNGDYLSISGSSTDVADEHKHLILRTVQVSGDQQSGIVDPYSDPPVNRPIRVTTQSTVYLNWIIRATLILAYEARRKRKETLLFTLTANFQPIVSEVSNDDDRETITISGCDVGLNYVGIGCPIGDPSRSSYFPTDRGKLSIEYLICVARAKLLARCRAVNVEFETSFERMINVNLRKNAQIFDPRLPGGTAIGKIIEYSLSGDGDSGEFVGKAVIACAIGYGDAVSGVPGTPVYVDSGYVQAGYQAETGGVTVLPATDVGYTPPVDTVIDDGLRFPLSKAQVAKNEQITQSTYKVNLKNVQNGPFNALYAVTLTELTAPKQIDLEAV